MSSPDSRSIIIGVLLCNDDDDDDDDHDHDDDDEIAYFTVR